MKSVVNSLRIFEEIARRQPVNLTTLAAVTALPYATVHRSVYALRQAGWVRPDALSPKSWRVSGRAESLFGRPSSQLIDVARPILTVLRDNTNESVSLSVLDGNDIEIVFHLDGNQSLRVVNVVGVRAPAHASAVGKSLIALLPAATRRTIAGGGLRTYTETTITDPDAFLEELEAVRVNGYAVMLGEWEPTVSSVAAAVTGPANVPIAGIGVSGPTERFTDRTIKEIAQQVCTAASSITERLAEVETAERSGLPLLEDVVGGPGYSGGHSTVSGRIESTDPEGDTLAATAATAATATTATTATRAGSAGKEGLHSDDSRR
jgi:DNA-binding IclR family transcriptional regulator